MIGIEFKRVPVTGRQAIELQEIIHRIMRRNLNDENKRELEARKARHRLIRHRIIWE